ncbi:MAG: hypothetical protein LQ342_004183 [Letrouitia transgressa]|nr:MAG: hypothetical protein LQ342_004183 [Letrouitia transgressa]
MATNPGFEIVVAHYNEDLAWLEQMKDACKIYTKGGPVNSPRLPCVALPNIGRGGHTFLHHITEQYHCLADVTLFVKGCIKDYVSIPITEMRKSALVARPGEVVTFPSRELEVFDQWEGIPRSEHPFWPDYKRMPKTPGQYYRELISWNLDYLPVALAFQPGAIFAVRRETIQQRSKAFYVRLLEELFLGEMAHVNPETEHYMERFWLAMWNPREYSMIHPPGIPPSSLHRNSLGQLAKGYWFRAPKGALMDVEILGLEEREGEMVRKRLD